MLEVDSVTTQEDEDSWTDLEDQDDTCSTCSTTSQVSEDTTFDSDSIWRLVEEEDISVLLSLDDDSITDDDDCSTVEDDSTTDDEHCSTTEDDSMTAADDSVTTEEDSTTLEDVSCDDDTDSVTDSVIAGLVKEDVGSIPLLPEVERGSNEFFRPGWRPQAAM